MSGTDFEGLPTFALLMIITSNGLILINSGFSHYNAQIHRRKLVFVLIIQQ
jgi:hypothetical protein